ncbi:PREDICTED: interferon-related developmental regulator 1 isoform X2 [Nelumbo nucifera]|uniref:Interferon-related developmental regulator 1 isoform X2 n=2 Tax=Nelumbo nucifera TaxID=4432 RepID=A0A1U8B831_NELNU|nr:PREDICTED: interferon-related developmental regulator 1 isoform X2 [Nelumbo nucifera]DAD41489.1 TPA_asm: hypothetical protein HUJ06_015812 [Nelumbo nucifera]
MGKRSSQRKTALLFESDDDDTLSSSSTTTYDSQAQESDKLSDSGLEQCLDKLSEKRGSTRESALLFIIDAFTNKLQHQFVEKNCITLLHQCLNSIKKGSSKEISLACRVIGLLAITVGCGNSAAAHEILEDSIPPLSQALKSGSDPSKISSILDCLAVITFVGGNVPEEIERSMQIMWQFIYPKSGPNVNASKPTVPVLTTAISAWSFLLTTISGWRVNSKIWQDSIAHFSGLLDKDDRSIRIASGEAIALIFEIGQLEKFSSEAKVSSQSSVHEGNNSREGCAYIQGLRGKILNQVRNLSVEAGGKGLGKKDLNSQRNLFKDITDFLEDGYCPETSMKIGGDLLNTSTWSQLIQLNFLKHFLGGGFTKHMLDVFEFTPRGKHVGAEHIMSNSEKRLYKSPNSIVNKARTQLLNKQRMISQGRNVGHFAVGVGIEE